MFVKFIIALVLTTGVHSFPDGAPIDACVKDRANQPNHGQHRTQPLSSLPYRVVASSTVYGPNTPITGLVIILVNYILISLNNYFVSRYYQVVSFRVENNHKIREFMTENN